MKKLDVAVFSEYNVPAYMQQGLLDWINHGILPGSFLTAVLENNLMEAVGRADSTNSMRLKDYAQFLYNGAPADCHGSKEKVAAWARRFETAAA